MYFRVLDTPLPAALLTQCAEVAAGAHASLPQRKVATLTDARVYLLKHMTTPRVLVCAGIEGDRVRGVAVGVVETRTWPAMFQLSVFCVAPDRQSQGFGSDLLDFTLRHAHARGADFAHIALPLDARAQRFLVSKGFRPDEDGIHLRYPMSEDSTGVMSANEAAHMFSTDEVA
ncbi:MAG TPA: GNAT family N-acetyltransferase [Verrucomicrobiae bacterium]|nr:GNAT family N-acetyltransferase [Verrucomicrobiae bacterium]